jgi:hypothetical protein
MDKFSAEILISFCCNDLELFSAHTSSFKFPMNHGIMGQYETVVFQELKKFIEEVIWVLLDKTK